MKRLVNVLSSFFAVAAMLVLLSAGIARAAATSDVSKDESKLKADITLLNSAAKLPQADQVIKKQLTDQFNVKSDKIGSLLGKKMQYGEVAAVLAFADKMSGGVTDANINQVMSMVQRHTGWSQIAKSLNVDLSDVASKVGSIEDDAHKNIKDTLARAGSAAGTGAGGQDNMSEQQPAATGGTGTDLGTGGSSGEGSGGGDMGGSTGGSSGGSSSGSMGGSGGGGY